MTSTPAMTETPDNDTLSGRLLADKAKRPRVLAACERLIEDEVARDGTCDDGARAMVRATTASAPTVVTSGAP